MTDGAKLHCSIWYLRSTGTGFLSKPSPEQHNVNPVWGVSFSYQRHSSSIGIGTSTPSFPFRPESFLRQLSHELPVTRQYLPRSRRTSISSAQRPSPAAQGFLRLLRPTYLKSRRNERCHHCSYNCRHERDKHCGGN